MTFEELNQLKSITARELKFTEENILSKTLNLPYFYHKYLDLYIGEKIILDKLGAEKKKIYSERYDFYKFKNNFKLDSAKEIETYINGDQQYDEKCLEYNKQEICVNYIVEVLDMIKKMNFSISSYIKYREFLSGK